MRLVVNQQGDRVYDREVNVLTVVTNETYQNYVAALQAEFKDEAGESAPPIEQKRKRVSLHLKADALTQKSFQNLWKILAKRAKFIVSMREDEIVKQCVDEINKIDETNIREIKVRVTKTGIETLLLDNIRQDNEIFRGDYIVGKSNKLPNIITLLQAETKLTKKTLLSILQKVSNFALFFKNSYQYVNFVSFAIKTVIQELASKGVSYVEINDNFSLSLFSKEIQTYDKYIVKLRSAKTLYKTNNNGHMGAVVIDPSPSEEGVSQPEKKFAESVDRDESVQFFFKLPETYFIVTPAGKYTPDWAVVVERGKQTQVYFIAETKDSNIISALSKVEQIKILSARAMFKNIMPEVVFKAPIKEFGDL